MVPNPIPSLILQCPRIPPPLHLQSCTLPLLPHHPTPTLLLVLGHSSLLPIPPLHPPLPTLSESPRIQEARHLASLSLVVALDHPTTAASTVLVYPTKAFNLYRLRLPVM